MNRVVVMSEADVESLLDRVVRQVLNQRGIPEEFSTEYLDIGQAAKFLRMSESSLYTHTSQRRVPFIKRGRRLHFKKSDLLVWLDEGRKKTCDEIAEEAGISRKGGSGDDFGPYVS